MNKTSTIKRIAAAAAVTIAVSSAAAFAAAKKDTPPPPVEKIIDITYITRGQLPVKGNLYVPTHSGKGPAIVLAHGGGFIAGDKDHYNIPEISEFFASRGYVVFSVNYRLLQQGGMFPGNAQDVKCAVQWLRANAEKYGVDTSRIAIMGNSAGGYMASFTAVTQHNPEFNASCGDPTLDEQKPEVALAVAWYGVHDLATLKGSLVSTMEKIYFSRVKDKEAFKVKVSPITYAADAPPPFFMLHGDADQLVNINQSRSMCAAVKAAKVECTLVEFPGMAHGFIDEKFRTEGSFKALEMTVQWLDAHFAKKTD